MLRKGLTLSPAGSRTEPDGSRFSRSRWCCGLPRQGLFALRSIPGVSRVAVSTERHRLAAGIREKEELPLATLLFSTCPRSRAPPFLAQLKIALPRDSLLPINSIADPETTGSRQLH